MVVELVFMWENKGKLQSSTEHLSVVNVNMVVSEAWQAKSLSLVGKQRPDHSRLITVDLPKTRPPYQQKHRRRQSGKEFQSLFSFKRSSSASVGTLTMSSPEERKYFEWKASINPLCLTPRVSLTRWAHWSSLYQPVSLLKGVKRF